MSDYSFIEADRSRGTYPIQDRGDVGQVLNQFHQCADRKRGLLQYAVGIYGNGLPAGVPWSAFATCDNCDKTVVRWFEWRGGGLIVPRF